MISLTKPSDIKVSEEGFQLKALEFQKKTIDHISQYIEKDFTSSLSPKTQGRCVILITGSDARGETYSLDPKKRESPIELVAVYDPSSDNESNSEQVELPNTKLSRNQKISAMLQKTIDNNEGLFYKTPQLISINSNPLNYTDIANKTKTIPPRVVDAIPITENDLLVKSFQGKIISSLENIKPQEVKSFNESFYKETKNYLKKTMDLKMKEPVNLETGQLTYNGKRIKSVKYIFCRAVQYKIVKIYMQAIKNGVVKAQDIVINMPKNTSRRLAWLQEKKLLNKDTDVNKLIDAYQQCLQWYAQSQEAYSREKQQTIEVDQKRLTEVANEIYKFFNSTTDENSFGPVKK